MRPVASTVDPATVASVHTIFSRSRLAHNAWKSRRFEGRCEGRNVWRSDAQGAIDIFRDRRGVSPTVVNVWLLVDASGSMGGSYSGSKASHAQDISATLAEAFKRVQSVKLRVWQHDYDYAQSAVILHRVYEPGMSLSAIDGMAENGSRGNADGFALHAIGEMALKQSRPGERVMIIVISDGEPTDHGVGATNRDLVQHSWTISEGLRRKGVDVLCVAIEREVSYTYSMYGEANVVPFKYGQPSAWNDLARGLANLFGKTLKPR